MTRFIRRESEMLSYGNRSIRHKLQRIVIVSCSAALIC